MSEEELQKSIDHTKELMEEAARKLDFIQAAQYRDEIIRLQSMLKEKDNGEDTAGKPSTVKTKAKR